MSEHPYKNSRFHRLLREYYKSGKRPKSKVGPGHRWTYDKLAAAVSLCDEDHERSLAAIKSWLSGKHIPESVQRLADAFFDRDSSDADELGRRREFEESIEEARIVRQDERAGAFFVSAIPDDETLRRVRAFDETAYGRLAPTEPNNIPFSLFAAWRRTYPHGLMGAFPNTLREPAGFVDPETLTIAEKESVFAVFGFLPVKKTWSDQFIARQVTERRLYPEDFGAPESRFWYVSGISSQPEHLKRVKRIFFIRHFIQKAFGYWRSTSGLNGRALVTIVAEGSTENGRKLLEDMQFKRAAEPGHPQELPLYKGIMTVDELTDHLAASIYSRASASSLASCSSSV